MAKSVTPLVGLAVVVALAMVAVFGAMSLTNPAFAAVGAPADAELAERTFSPQDATTTVAMGEALSYNIAPLITGGGANYDGVVGAISCVPACGKGSPITAPPVVMPDFGAINLTVPAGNVAATGRVRVSVEVNLKDSTTNQDIKVDVTVTATVNEPSTLRAAIPDQTVTIRASKTDTASTTINLKDYFMSGRGDGAIGSYKITFPKTSGLVHDLPKTSSDLKLYARPGTTPALVAVTVEAVDGHTDPNPSYTFFVDMVESGTGPTTAPTVGLPSFVQSSDDPGDSANYTVKFEIPDGVTVNTRQNDLVIEFHEDYGFPASMRTTSVAITTTGGVYPTVSRGDVSTRTFTPEDVTVDGEKALISLGDMDEQDDRFDYEIAEGEIVTVHFRQSAGITNPTEYGGFNLEAIEFGSIDIGYNDEDTLSTNIVRKLSLSEEDGGLGDMVTATGKGFKNGTTLTVFRDLVDALVMYDHDDDASTAMIPLPGRGAKTISDGHDINVPWVPFDGDDARWIDSVPGEMYAWAPSGELELGEDVLCVVAKIGSDDVGRCEFTVTHPTFSGGLNYVNAVDGRNGYDINPDDFLLEASIAASPAGGSPGETIVIQVVDFPKGRPLTDVEISRQSLQCGGCGGSADETGADNFQIVIPNWVKAGSQELRVTAVDAAGNTVRASTNIDLLGPQINVTPGIVLANQRISLVGTGFSPGSVIANESDTTRGSVTPEVSIGGRVIHGTRINDADPVRVDNGGNWSASVDLPLAEATTADGERVIRVSDSRGRTGAVVVNVPTREVTVTPEAGRVGTIAVVRGTGFPSKNDEGSSFNIEIVYDASNGNTTTVSASPDASGRFETQLRIPTTAAIPSSNSIKVSFRDTDGVLVVTTVAHEVPEGVITLSETSGGPGSTVTVTGEGFKSFVPISLVKVGTLDVTPAPKPSTDGNGMMSFDITIPGLDVGIQTIEVNVGRTTSSTGFTVTESGVNPGDIKAVAAALEELGDNVVSVWNFNNDTKVWSFYDPTLADGNTLTHMITGETYLLRVKFTAEVILNNDTRNLTCVGENCWNQVVW